MSDSRAKDLDPPDGRGSVGTEADPITINIETRLIRVLAEVNRLRGDERFALTRDNYRKGWVEFTGERREDFLIALALTGRMGDSALAAGVTPRTVNRHMDEDEDFGELVEQARECYRDAIRVAIYEDGVEGRLEPVIARGEDGPEIVAWIRKRNPKILELAAKLNLPEYKEASALMVNIDARTGVLVVAPAAASAEEWAERFGGKVLPPQGEGLQLTQSSATIGQEKIIK